MVLEVAQQVSLRRVGKALLAFGALILLTAYVAICIYKGTLWPWNVVVHEDGKRNLIQTILYYEHATRELPIDVLLGVAIGGAALFGLPPSPTSAGPSGKRVLGLAAAGGALVVLMLIGTLHSGGLSGLQHELLQYHSRPGAPLKWGAHWHYHLGERLPEMLISIGIGGALLLLAGRKPSSDPTGFRIAGLAVGVFLIFTVVFAQSFSSLAGVFSDPVVLGHEAREILTHCIVTVPVAWGAILLYQDSGTLDALPGSRLVRGASSVSPQTVAALAAGVLGIVVALYICIAALASGSASYGQSDSLAVLLFPHFFEHGFTYAITAIVAVLVYVTGSLRAREPHLRSKVRGYA